MSTINVYHHRFPPLPPACSFIVDIVLPSSFGSQFTGKTKTSTKEQTKAWPRLSFIYICVDIKNTFFCACKLINYPEVSFALLLRLGQRARASCCASGEIWFSHFSMRNWLPKCSGGMPILALKNCWNFRPSRSYWEQMAGATLYARINREYRWHKSLPIN